MLKLTPTDPVFFSDPQKDSLLARLLFSSVFKAIFAKIEEEKTEREAVEMTEKLRQSLNDMLQKSTQYFPPFIGCILVRRLQSPSVYSKRLHYCQPLEVLTCEKF